MHSIRFLQKILGKIEHAKSLLVKKLYLIKTRLTLQTSMRICPLCTKQTTFKVILNKDRYGLPIKTVICECGLIMANPSPTDNFIKKFYESNSYRGLYTGVLKARTGGYNDRAREKAVVNKKFVEENLSLNDHANILDFGSADGESLIELKKINPTYKIFGLEPGANFSKINQNLLDGLYENLDQIDVNKKFDLITLWHVLEHLPDPVVTLKKLREKLTPEGVIALEVPTTDKYSGIRPYHIAHLYHFNSKTIKMAADRAGLMIKSIGYDNPISKENGMRVIMSNKDTS